MSTKPMSEKPWKLCRVRLERALEPGAAAQGDNTSARGYEFVAPLDAGDHISVEGWRAERALCFVHRTEHGATLERGLLTHRPGGAEGATWMFDYDPLAEGDEEAGFRFGSHRFVAGEYVTLREPDGAAHTYRVASVRDA